ncbi:hypothetical protein GGR58DRAFT_309059 [Xylaria digitata]|nr:hypothetical protein GGR58DRAFT_309059 [Xylaria digitata]
MTSTLIDSSALLDDEGLVCTSWDAPVTDGGLKTLIHRQNRTDSEVQPLIICYENSESYFKVKTKIITCIHGYMETINNIPTRPATLIVLEYRLNPETGHRFSSMETTFTFKDAAESPGSNPRVFSYAPFPHPRRFHIDKQAVEKTDGYAGNVGTSDGLPFSAGGSANKSVKKSHMQEYFAKGSAGTDPDETTDVENTIWWKLEENKLQKHGVLEVFRVAVLVERDDLSDFCGFFTLDVQGSFTSVVGKLAEKVMRFLRRATLDDPVNFSPTRMKSQGKTNGIKVNELASLVKYTKDGEGIYLPEDYDIENLLPAEAFIGQKTE